jgi:nitrogen regulatory protein PII
MLGMQVIIVIVNRELIEDFILLYKKHDLPLTHVALGHGTASREILEMLGLEASEKAVIFSIAREEKVLPVLKSIDKNLDIRRLGAGIVLTVPISSIGGEITAQYLAEHRPIERKEQQMASEDSFELIIAIAREGYSNLVVDAARNKGGATGATILHSRGVGKEKDQKFFGISISDEKEMIFIACRSHCKNQIMKAIMDEAGLNSKAKSIVFSVPVSSAAGLWILEDADDEA